MKTPAIMTVFSACLLLGLAATSPAAAEPADTVQLFVNDRAVEEMSGLRRTLHQPVDHAANPVIVPEHPWEHRRIPFGSVLWFPAEKKFRCWYLTLNIYDSRPGFRGYRKQHHIPVSEAAYLCYAESADGVNWTRPELGLHEFRGSKRNNIVLASPGTHFDSVSVMHVPELGEWPFRMMAFIGRWPYREDLVKKQWGDPPPFGIRRHGHFAFESKDGIRWTMLNDQEPVLRAHDRSMFWWDARNRRFIGAAKRTHDGKRAQALAVSRDMIRWEITKQWVHRADERDDPRDEAEAAYGFPYGGQWLGFAEMRRPRNGTTLINWELLTSPDGRAWNRPLRQPFFADAEPATWRHEVFKVFANPPVERDGRLLIYYGGKTGTVPVNEGMKPFQALCLATLRLDGFVSLRAGEAGGVLTTRTAPAKGAELLLNLAVRPGGEARVEVLDERGTPVPGFEQNRCRTLRGQSTAQPVRWTGAHWRDLAGRRVRLRIRLRAADLYAIRFRNPS